MAPTCNPQTWKKSYHPNLVIWSHKNDDGVWLRIVFPLHAFAFSGQIPSGECGVIVGGELMGSLPTIAEAKRFLRAAGLVS